MNIILGNIFVVYVEDDRSNRRVMSLLMKRGLGIKDYVEFEDTTNFMQRLDNLQRRPDILLLDIHVQPHNGFEILQMVRKHSQYARTKTIALTASVTNEEVEQLRSRGFDGAIGKPIKLSTFEDLLRRILSGEAVWSIS